MIEQLKRVLAKFGSDRVTQISAAVAYYAFLSLFPLLLVLVSLLGYALKAGLPAAINAEDAVLNAVRSNFTGNNDLGKLIGENIQAVIDARGAAGGIGLITLLLSAGGIFSQLRTAFDIIWNVGELKLSLVQKITSNLVPILLVIAIAPLLLASMVIDAVLKFVINHTAFVPGSAILWAYLTPVISAAVVVVAFAAMYRYFPQTDVQWRDVWPGAILAGAVWELGKQLLVWYVSRGQSAVYGALGGVISLLLFLYYTGLILFLGAEWAAVRSEERRKATAPTAPQPVEAGPAEPKRPEKRSKGKLRVGPAQAFVGGVATGVVALVGAAALAANRFLRSHN